MRGIQASVVGMLGLCAGAQGQIVVGPDEGGPPLVRVYDPVNPAPPLATIHPTTPSFSGGVRVGVGDFNGDGFQDILTGLGPGAGPHVKVFTNLGNGPVLTEFDAFSPSFSGGIFVGAGDVNNDHFTDIIVGAGPGGGSHVKVFSGADGALLASFFAYSPSFGGGVRVAGGDVNGNGGDDILVAGTTAYSPVKVFDGSTGAEIRSFLAFPGFTGVVSVASGDVNNDGFDDIIVGAQVNGHVKVFDGRTGAESHSFFAFGASAPVGITVGAVDRNGDGVSEIIVGAGPGAPPEVRVFTASGALLASFLAGDPGFTGGVFVAGFDGGCYPDCTGDGLLTVADFGCFQTKFVGGSPYADCNGDGARTVADFGCFQTRFVQGCP